MLYNFSNYKETDDLIIYLKSIVCMYFSNVFKNYDKTEVGVIVVKKGEKICQDLGLVTASPDYIHFPWEVKALLILNIVQPDPLVEYLLHHVVELISVVTVAPGSRGRSLAVVKKALSKLGLGYDVEKINLRLEREGGPI